MGTPEPVSSAAPLSFDRVAEEYEATRFLPPSVADAVARRVADGAAPADWLLDAGVGTGRLGRALARRHRRTAGVDVSLGMMRQLLTWAGRAGERPPCLVRADLRTLPFPEHTFSAVLAAHVFHLIRDWERALAEVWRVLRPGGALFVAVEDRSRTQVREFYLQRAGELGVLAATQGVHSSLLLATLQDRFGATVREESRAADLFWRHRIPARETLAMLERRTYSVQWDLHEETHQALLRQTRDWTLRRLGSLDAEEAIQTQLVLYRVQKRE